MKKVRILIVVFLLVLVMLPYVLGFEIKNRYRGLLSQFEDAGYQLVSHEYDQGFSESQARSVLSVPVMTPQGEKTDFRLKIVSDIKHGPYTFSQGWIGDLTRFQTRFYHQDKSLFPQDPDSRIETRMAFSGDGRTDIDLPALSKPLEIDDQLFLEFSGLQGQIDFNVVDGTISIDAGSDGLKLQSPGQGELEIGKMRVLSDSRRGIAGLMLGRGSFEIAYIRMNDSQRGFNVDIQDVSISADTRAEDNNINMLARYAVSAIDVAGQQYGPAVVELELFSIAAEAMARIQQSIQQMQSQQVAPEQQGMAIMGVFMSVVPALLEQDPGVALKKLELNTPQGKVEASLSLKADSMSIADMSIPDRLLKKMTGDAHIRIPESLLHQLLSNISRQQLMVELAKNQDEAVQMPSPEEIDELVDQQVSAQLEGFVGQGLLQRSGPDFQLAASLKAGLFSVNGNVIPLPVIQ